MTLFALIYSLAYGEILHLTQVLAGRLCVILVWSESTKWAPVLKKYYFSHKDLNIRDIQVQVQIVVQRRGNAGSTGTEMEDVAVMTGPTSGRVVHSTGGAG